MKKRVKKRVKYDLIIILSLVIFFAHLGIRVDAMGTTDDSTLTQTNMNDMFDSDSRIKTATESSIVTENMKTTTSKEKEKDVIVITTPTPPTPKELSNTFNMQSFRSISSSAIAVTTGESVTSTPSAILLAESYDSKDEMPKCAVASPTPKPEPPSTTYKAPEHSGFKSWLPHKKQNGSNMFASWSAQYKLQENAVNSPNGLRKYKDRYLIALGSYYTETIGTYVDLIMEDGTVIECMLGDQKADKDTDSKNQVHNDGSLVEFLVDRSAIPHKVKYKGDMSYVDETFNQKVAYIKVYEKIAKY